MTSKLMCVFAISGLILSVTAAAWAQTAEWTVYNTGNSGLPYNGVTALAIDAQENVWAGTGRWWAFAGGGLAKFDGEAWTVYNTSNSQLPNNDHVSLSIDRQGNIWSGTEGGLSKFDGQNWTVYKTNNSGMRDDQCGAPAFDAEGNGWIPCGGLAKFDGANWTVYHTGNSDLPNNFVTDVAIDTHGNIWASTFGSGAVEFDGQNWAVYNRGNSGLPHNDVCFVDADGMGNVWAGTYGGGLAKFDGAGWTAYTSANSGLPDNWIWNLSVDPEGNVWAGTKAGLVRFDGVHWRVYDSSNSGLPDNNVYCVAFGAEGRIWVGTQDGGLALFRPRPVVDFNGNGTVDINDLLRLIESWGQDDPSCDIGPTTFGDGIVDEADLRVLMSYWGQEVEDGTLAAHWKFDETEGIIASNSTGAHDATVMGAALWQPDGGCVHGALKFDGATFAVADFVLSPSNGPFSVFAWVKGGAPGQAILSQQAGHDWLLLDAATGALMTELKSKGRLGKPLFSDAVITDANWHRVGFTWDGFSRSLYVDNILVADDTQSGLAEAYGGLNIGAGKDLGVDTFWTGLIDDVRIYTRVVRP
jgi:sugar lactone lactonase YvrE